MQKKRKMICSKCRNDNFVVYSMVDKQQTGQITKPFPLEIVSTPDNINYFINIRFKCTKCEWVNCTEGLIM